MTKYALVIALVVAAALMAAAIANYYMFAATAALFEGI